MKLNWFSPLPPARTEIAQYTMRILPALQEWAEVTLWTDQKQWDRNIDKIAEVCQYVPEQMPWAVLNRADLSIFNIGNNHLFHGSIWQISRRHPGVVILHDLVLQDFFAGIFLGQWKDKTGYLEKMELYYGKPGRDVGEAICNGGQLTESILEQFPLTPLALESALGSIVHTFHGFQALKAENHWSVCYAPLPHAIIDTGKDSRKKAGIPYQLVMFGYIGSNRRLDAVLRALADFPDRNKFRLSIYGEILDKESVVAAINQFGLKKLVTIQGYVNKEALDRGLSAADLAINLRYPTMGEASASQLRIWEHRLPSMVTKVGWYAELSEDAVVFVRLEHEVEDITEHLRAFLNNPERFVTMGEAGRRILEQQHDPKAYAKAIIDFASNAETYRLQTLANDMAKRIGADLSQWLSPTISGELVSKVSQEILYLFQ